FVSRPAIQRPTGQQANGQFSFSPSQSTHPSVIRHSVTPLSIAQPPHQWTIQQPSTLLPDTRSCYASEPTMSLPAVHSRYQEVITHPVKPLSLTQPVSEQGNVLPVKPI